MRNFDVKNLELQLTIARQPFMKDKNDAEFWAHIFKKIFEQATIQAKFEDSRILLKIHNIDKDDEKYDEIVHGFIIAANVPEDYVIDSEGHTIVEAVQMSLSVAAQVFLDLPENDRDTEIVVKILPKEEYEKAKQLIEENKMYNKISKLSSN
ncbi:MAG: hypothetical protein PHH82_04795 [Candidatus ainarchaeum sp.]|nr:hypothetical protein [Candidatus ainarchaeum sp.]